MEFRFLEPSRKKKIDLKNRVLGDIGDKISVFDFREENEFDSSYQKV